MAQVVMQCPDGLWAVDWGIVRRIVHSRHLAVFQLAGAQVKEETEYFRVLGIPVAALPTWKHLEVNWDKVRSNADAATELTLQGINDTARTRGMRGVGRQLQNHLSETRDYNKKFFDKLRQTQRETMDSIDEKVENAKIGQEALTTIRDGSFTVVGVLAAATLGPAGQALVGGTTEAIIKLSDGGSSGEVALAFVANMGISAVPFLKGGSKYVQLAVNTGLKAGLKSGYAAHEASIQGKDVGEAILGAVVETGVGLGAEHLLAIPALKKMLFHTAYPFACKAFPQADLATNVAARLQRFKLPGEAIKGGVDAYAKAWSKERLEKSGSGSGAGSQSARATPAADARAIDPTKTNVILSDDYFLSLAVSRPTVSSG